MGLGVVGIRIIGVVDLVDYINDKNVNHKICLKRINFRWKDFTVVPSPFREIFFLRNKRCSHLQNFIFFSGTSMSAHLPNKSPCPLISINFCSTLIISSEF